MDFDYLFCCYQARRCIFSLSPSFGNRPLRTSVRYWEKAVMSEIGAPLVGFYDYRLVALSIFIAISASFMRTRSWRTCNCRSRLDPLRLVSWRSRCYGVRNLVDALHRDAGLQLTCPGVLRLADGSPVAPDRHPCLRRRTLRGEPKENGARPSANGQYLYGAWHCGDALHRNGCDASLCGVPLQSSTRGLIRIDSGSLLPWSRFS